MKKFILTGCPKTGNTWTRFVLFNYWNLLENNAEKTLSYAEIIQINEQIWNGNDQFPQIYFTHVPINGNLLFGRDQHGHVEMYEIIKNIIYVIRNPFDTMISYFHYVTNRDIPFNGHFKGKELERLMTFEGFIERFLPVYINHVKTTKPYAGTIVEYEKMRENPLRFFDTLEYVYGTIDKNIAREAIEISSFESIKKMGVETNQTWGLASAFRDHFTRNGKVGQYKEVMNEELIEYIKNECEREGIEIEKM